MLTVVYADNTLIDTNQHWLNEFPVNTPGGGAGCSGATPTPNGTIATSAGTTTITFDSTCININTGNTAIAVGDLLLLQNGQGMALVSVSTVTLASNKLTIASSPDPFKLNNSGKTAGTIVQIQSPANSYPATTVTRVKMITYYIDTSNSARPMLMRQVNMNTAQEVGETIENMQLYYDILAAGSSPPTITTNVTSPSVAQMPYIRDAYVTLFARSENTYSATKQYYRNNLTTAVSIRSLNFYNEFK